ncbi:MAG TPA: JAB domain-containing protein [Rubrivivax sp.]|nr:JAB domain-containing protein [Rubrivivax sp.]
MSGRLGKTPQDKQSNVKQNHLESLLNQRFATMVRITDSLSFRSALSLVDVRVLDHFVVAGDQIVSLAERGMI